MKTRGSAYKSDFKRIYVSKKIASARNLRSAGENNPKQRRMKGASNHTKRKRISETYKATHLVGRRKASNFVTYTQNGRLFYDIYVRESPYHNSKLMTIQKERVDGDDANAGHLSSVKRCTRSVRVGRSIESGEDSSQKMSLKAESQSFPKRAAKTQGSTTQPSSRLKRSRGRKKKGPGIHETLKRELGPNYASSNQVHGKRLASLNATAIMGAFNSKSPRKPYRRRNKELNTQLQSVLVVNCHLDEVDDAVTEPMCSVVGDDLVNCVETTGTLSIEKDNVFSTQNCQTPTPKKGSLESPFKNICQMNPAIESFHSQRIIPLGHDTYGVQQITHQVLVVPPPNDTSQIVCQPKLPGLSTPIVRAQAESPASFPRSPYPKSNDCHFNESLLQQKTSQIMYGPVCPSFLPQSLNSWSSGLPCITNSNMTSSFITCSPPNIIFPHISSPFVVPNPNVTPQVAYPLILQPISNMPTSYVSSGFPYSFVPPILLPTSWAQPGVIPDQSFSNPVSSNGDFISPMMIAPAQMVPINQTQYYQIAGNPCTNWLSQGGFYSTLSKPAVVTNVCCNSDQLVIGQDKKSLVGNQSVCPDDSSTRDSFSQSVTGYPIISCQTPVANSQETNVIMIASSNTSSLQTQSGEFLVNPGPVETRHAHENVTKEVNPDIVHLDNEKGAWIWEGKSFVKPIFYQSDSPPVLCKCYPAIRHRRDGMVIRAKDSVLLCSGPSRSHPPHVAKIVALYHDKNTDTKMMSLLWYYRPEHTNSTAQNFVKNELYASRHRDTNPLDCIEDKAFVLSVNAYSRYMAKLKRQQMGYRKMPLSSIVPQFGSCSLHGNKSPEDNLYMDKYPLSECDECFNSTNSQSVFFCRGLYDYKLKRVTRYPVFANQYLLSHSANRQKSNGQSFTTPQKQSTEQNNVTSLNEDCCSGTTTPSKQDASPGILNTIEPVTPLRDNVPFKVFSTPTTSTTENVNNMTILQSDSCEIDCENLHNSYMVEQCEPITYDNDKGRTSTPVKESSDQRKSPVKESLKFVEKSSEKLITTMNSSNEPSNKLPMINSSVNISQTNISVPVDCITSSSNLQLQFSTYSVSENKLYEVTKDSNVHLLPGINHSSSVYNKLPYENKLVNQLVCQSNFLPIQSIWPTTSTSLTNYDRSILETSADLSVNWGEHGEQIALSLDCRVKEKDIHNHNCNDQTTSHFIHSEPLTTSTQSFIDMTKLPVHSNTIDYSTLKSKCLDQDQPRLVIL